MRYRQMMRNFFKLKEPMEHPQPPEDLQNVILPSQAGLEHLHQWKDKLVTYAPPRRSFDSLSSQDSAMLVKVLLGCTSILSECVDCHEPRTLELLGSQDIQLDDMLDKADLYGPQYLQRDGKTFLIQKYQVQSTGALPLR